MSEEFKMGVLSLAVVGTAFLAFARWSGTDFSIADMATQLLQLGAHLLHRALL
ncbi:hypothetical protein [Cupriavidus pinatubonensis]|uniref:hypothetical protein n=1 Tax=Cupriavidus pinatubonensis TaxID=248026 RepID=UPI001CC439D2|nr:hypothetical protein [Cupriavidus pinatubonensis]